MPESVKWSIVEGEVMVVVGGGGGGKCSMVGVVVGEVSEGRGSACETGRGHTHRPPARHTHTA